MSIRVFDTQLNDWHYGEFCISANEDLVEIKKRPFGLEKIELLSDERYIWHKDIGLYDLNGNLIFEGDICEMNLPMEFDNPDNDSYETSYHLVAYSYDNAAYYLVDMENGSCCRFNKEVIQYLTVIGNVFNVDDIEELEEINMLKFNANNDEDKPIDEVNEVV